MTDEECIDFYNKNLKGKHFIFKYVIKKYPDFIEYIRNRFKDSTGNESIKELIYRIKNKIEEKPKCIVCGNSLIFSDRNNSYQKKYCSNDCKNSIKGIEMTKQLRFNTCIKKYGNGYYNNRNQYKNTCIKKFGVDNPLKSSDVVEKMKETNLKIFGVENVFQSYIIKQKIKETCLERYGVKYPMQSEEIKNKSIKTSLLHYGVDHPHKSNIIKEQSKQTCLSKYGVEYTFQLDNVKNKIKQTCLQRYNVENPKQNEQIKEKAMQTTLYNYGVDNPLKSKEIKQKIKQTFINKFGVDHPMKCKEIMLKAFKTKFKNQTKYSKEEDKIYNHLITIDKDTKRQYYSDLYPFHCDFYLPKYDLYIEYNGTWTHGKHPFNKDNEDDIELLNKWEDKAKNSTFYKNAINTWTISDTNKRNIAYENKLNFIEIFYIKKTYHFIGYYNNKYIDEIYDTFQDFFDKHEMFQ